MYLKINRSCSAVIPVYNAEKYICQAIDSLLAQTVPLAKIILVDDGSSDESVRLIQQRYERELLSGCMSLKILPRNAGVSAARNAGVALVDTDWFIFLDADDTLAAETVANLLARSLELDELEHPYDLIHPAYQLINEEGVVTSPVIRWRQVGFEETSGWMFYRNHIMSPSGLLVNREQFVRLGGFDETLAYSEDAELWLRFSYVSGIGYVDQPLVSIRRHPGNASKQVADMLQGELNILRRYSLDDIRSAMMRRSCDPEKNSADYISILYRLDLWEQGFEEALSAKLEFPDARTLDFMIGLCWLKKTNMERALPYFLNCDIGEGTNGAVLNNIGAIYLHLDAPVKATTYLNRALELHPNYMDALANKELLGSDHLDVERVQFTWRELRAVMISYTS